MEHRYSDRLTADLNIVIYKKNLLVAMGVVKNIGSEGVFIESGFDDLSVNQPLEIEFIGAEKMQKSRRLKAIVVHRTDTGFGAEIEDIAEQIKLASLLYQHPLERGMGANARPTSGTDFGYASL
jgi:hypothetical protein